MANKGHLKAAKREIMAVQADFCFVRTLIHGRMSYELWLVVNVVVKSGRIYGFLEPAWCCQVSSKLRLPGRIVRMKRR
ncbi:hypothetical protein ACFL27_27110 [candidate division CSSED10-310 bacterium]|uniref:Uncharacterized protein n=1 Tax=candidate division CSSED10-310 bacterium TaxID=2855610 RepID=A0ABV6Z5Z0_UNCC1